MPATSSFSRTAPVGLFGNPSRIARVRGVIAAATSSGLRRNASSSRVGTATGTPPASTMPGMYATYDGSARMTSSPSFSVARIARSTASDTPTVTMISRSGS